MTIIYYFFFGLVLLTVGPFLLLTKKARAGLFQKLGFVPSEFKAKVSLYGESPRIWFHAVSVGEFNAVLPLIEEFHNKHPEYKIFISNTTATGHEQAKAKASKLADMFFFPFDLPWATNTWLDLIKPRAVAIVETERWPGFMEECKTRKIPVLLLNGRLSPKSFRGYKRFQFFFASVLNKFSALAVQSESEKERFAELMGNPQVPIRVCGNIKLDGAKPCSDAEKMQLRHKLGLGANEIVVVAGSTHEGEESAFLNSLKELNYKFRLILVPRHPERFQRVATLIESSGSRAKKFSLSDTLETEKDVYLLDTIGQLTRFYSIADIAFVGGTIANIGGHNLVEPCIYKTPVICGPHIHKTKDLFQKMQEANALQVLNDEKELSPSLKFLLDSPQKRKELGENGYNFLAQSQGALAKTLALLEEYLHNKGTDTELRVETAGGVRR